MVRIEQLHVPPEVNRAQRTATVLCSAQSPWLISFMIAHLILANRYVFLTPTQTLTCVIVKSHSLAISTRQGLSGLQ